MGGGQCMLPPLASLLLVLNMALKTVIDLLLLLGKLPDDKDVITTDLRANVNMDGLMFEVDELMNNELSSFSTEDLRHLLEALIQIQADNGDMKVEKSSKIYGIEQPTVLSERSNASSINTVDNSLAHLAGESKDDISEDEEQSFTDAELQLMSEKIAGELEAMLQEDSSIPAEIDEADIEEAYEEFLNEQQTILPVPATKGS